MAESAWHKEWKLCFPEAWCEVPFENGCRADVCCPEFVIEFQASDISYDEVARREAAYGYVVWVLKAEDFWDNLKFRDRRTHVTFRWKNPRKAWLHGSQVVLDCGNGLLIWVRKIYPTLPVGAWGTRLLKEQFIEFCGVVNPCRV